MGRPLPFDYVRHRGPFDVRFLPWRKRQNSFSL